MSHEPGIRIPRFKKKKNASEAGHAQSISEAHRLFPISEVFISIRLKFTSEVLNELFSLLALQTLVCSTSFSSGLAF
jgi:hypothetical protein